MLLAINSMADQGQEIQDEKRLELKTGLNPIIEVVVDELKSMARMLRPEAQEGVLRSTGALANEDLFSYEGFDLMLKSEVLRQIELFGIPKASMFICPRVDVRDMSKPSNLFPTGLSISSVDGRRADIFISRIPRIFQLFQKLAEKNAPLEFVLIIGDSDFAPNIGYQWKAIEFALKHGGIMGEFDEKVFGTRAKSYQKYLTELLRSNATQNGTHLFDVVTDSTPRTSPRTIRILSFYDLYKTDMVPISSDSEFNQVALDEESTSKLGHYREAVKKYDTAFFGRITPEEVRVITEGKFQSYRDQGLYIAQSHGRILLSDELPPILKAEMYRNQLLIFWPWIRKEDPERNPDVEFGRSYKVKLVEPAIES